MAEVGGFTDDHLSLLTFADGRAGVSHLKALALQNGFQLSARDSETGDRICLYCHRASRGGGHRNTTKTSCEINRQYPDLEGDWNRIIGLAGDVCGVSLISNKSCGPKVRKNCIIKRILSAALLDDLVIIKVLMTIHLTVAQNCRRYRRIFAHGLSCRLCH
jgi:hypothetical protein